MQTHLIEMSIGLKEFPKDHQSEANDGKSDTCQGE